VPADAPLDVARIGVEQELGRIEAVSMRRVPGSVDPVAVELTRKDAAQVAVPDVIGTARQADATGLVPLAGIEQAEIDGGRVLRKQGEIDAAPVEMRAKRSRHAVFDADHIVRCDQEADVVPGFRRRGATPENYSAAAAARGGSRSIVRKFSSSDMKLRAHQSTSSRFMRSTIGFQRSRRSPRGM
jgi:hypothetical protein